MVHKFLAHSNSRILYFKLINRKISVLFFFFCNHNRNLTIWQSIFYSIIHQIKKNLRKLFVVNLNNIVLQI